MLQKNIVKGTSRHADTGDFCRIFAEEMNRLYLLSFLLTADRGKAEQCFVSGLEDCIRGSQVFSAWAPSWARRAIIQNAVQTMQLSGEETRQASLPLSESGATAIAEMEAPFAAAIGLNTFERFVFVLSVLERYSDQDCRVLLKCSLPDVVRARIQALKRIGSSRKRPPLRTVPSADETLAQAS